MKFLVFSVAVFLALSFYEIYPTANAEVPSLTTQEGSPNLKIPGLAVEAHQDQQFFSCECCHDPGGGCWPL